MITSRRKSGSATQQTQEVFTIIYPFITLNDGKEIVHSEMQTNGQVKVYIETPDEQYGFKHATCFLPQYQWNDILGYTNSEIDYFQEIPETTAHLILQFSQEGGFENASNFQDRFILGLFLDERKQTIRTCSRPCI